MQAAEGSAEEWVRGRVAEAETALAPLDAFGPGAAGGDLLPAGEALLDDCRFAAEFVPRELGGRLERMDVLGRLVRPLCRRNLGLALGHGLTGHVAATPVWLAGTAAQRAWAAGLLLGGERFAVAGPAPTADLPPDGPALRRDGNGRRLAGVGRGVCNFARARALTVVAATAEGRHEVALVDRETLPAGALRVLGTRAVAGLEGCEFSDLSFADCPVPAETLVGAPDHGGATAARSSVVTRVMPQNMLIAATDTLLRTATRFAVEHPGAGSWAPLRDPHVREALTGALLNLLISDCLTTAAARGLHLLPDRVSACATAAAHLVPRLLRDTAYALTAVLGAAHFDRRGPYGTFGRTLRDLSLLTRANAGNTGALALLSAQLPRLARESWFRDSRRPPAALLRPWLDLPPARLAAVAPMSGADPLVPVLLSGAGADGPQGDLVAAFVGELRDLKDRFTALDPGAVPSTPLLLALADRYALVCAAAAGLGVWREYHLTRRDTLLADPVWITGALHRLGRYLGSAVPDPPEDLERRLLDAVLDRHEQRISYDLHATPVGPGPEADLPARTGR
ncbi:acyl-CoA dehydrogenase [Streptomyces sp. CWNU-52B]|uniref:acyl-CoA dehydrogenase n=1 Tax=unclassified Streptomyces TaxID=2593676 RepID=UPI0039C237A8